jgi:hypothetical protein
MVGISSYGDWRLGIEKEVSNVRFIDGVEYVNER